MNQQTIDEKYQDKVNKIVDFMTSTANVDSSD